MSCLSDEDTTSRGVFDDPNLINLGGLPRAFHLLDDFENRPVIQGCRLAAGQPEQATRSRRSTRRDLNRLDASPRGGSYSWLRLCRRQTAHRRPNDQVPGRPDPVQRASVDVPVSAVARRPARSGIGPALRPVALAARRSPRKQRSHPRPPPPAGSARLRHLEDTKRAGNPPARSVCSCHAPE